MQPVNEEEDVEKEGYRNHLLSTLAFLLVVVLFTLSQAIAQSPHYKFTLLCVCVLLILAVAYLVQIVQVATKIHQTPIVQMILGLAVFAYFGYLQSLYVQPSGLKLEKLASHIYAHTSVNGTHFSTQKYFQFKTKIQAEVISSGERNYLGSVRFKVKAKIDGLIEADLLLYSADLPWVEMSDVKPGDKFEADIFLFPALHSPDRYPSLFSYEAYLLRRGFIGRGKIILVHSIEKGTYVQTRWEQFVEELNSIYSNTDVLGVTLAATVAESEFVSEEIKQLFRTTGLSHVLVVSGFNIGLVFIIFSKLARYLLSRFQVTIIICPLQISATMFGLLASIIYTSITGFMLATGRALLAVILYAIAQLIDRRGDLFRIYLFVIFLILIICPGALFEVGSQLTFAALAGLMIGARQIGRLEDSPIKNFFCRKFIENFLMCLYPAIFTTPILLIWFKEFIPCSIFYNFFFAPLFTLIFILFGGLMIAINYFALPGGQLLMEFYAKLSELFLWLLRKLSNQVEQSILGAISIENVANMPQKYLVLLVPSLMLPIFILLSEFKQQRNKL